MTSPSPSPTTWRQRDADVRLYAAIMAAEHDIPDAYHLPDWYADAACAPLPDRSMFFPSRGDSVKPAKAICRTCPVRDDCLDYALTTGQHFGIWGGTSERERRRIRRRRTEATA